MRLARKIKKTYILLAVLAVLLMAAPGYSFTHDESPSPGQSYSGEYRPYWAGGYGYGYPGVTRPDTMAAIILIIGRSGEAPIGKETRGVTGMDTMAVIIHITTITMVFTIIGISMPGVCRFPLLLYAGTSFHAILKVTQPSQLRAVLYQGGHGFIVPTALHAPIPRGSAHPTGINPGTFISGNRQLCLQLLPIYLACSRKAKMMQCFTASDD